MNQFLIAGGFAALLGQAGPVGDPIPVHPGAVSALNFIFPATSHAIECAGSGDRTLSVYTAMGAGLDLYARLIDASTGSVGAPLPLDLSLAASHSPAIAWNPTVERFLVVFVRERAAFNGRIEPNVFGLVLDRNGVPVGSALPFQISATDRPPSATPWYLNPNGDPGDAKCRLPKVASSGNGWLVVWQYNAVLNDGLAIEGRAIGGSCSNDAPQYSTAILSIDPSLMGAWHPAVAFGAGGDYVVTWLGARQPTVSGSFVFGVLGRTVSQDGRLGPSPAFADFYATPRAGAPFPVLPSTPSITVNRDEHEYLVAWDEDPVGDSVDTDIMARRIGPDGQAIAPAVPIARDPARLATAPTVSWSRNAGQYFVAWLDYPVDGSSPTAELRAARLCSGDASVLAGNLLVADGMTDFYPSSAAGDEVIVQWLRDDGSTSCPLEAQRWSLGPNANAPTPGSLSQARVDGMAPVPPGGIVAQTSLALLAKAGDPQRDDVRIEIELRESTVPFSGAPTASSPLVTSGSTAAVPVANLVRGRGYHWQARGVDAKGHASGWVCFQDDPASIDFLIRGNVLPTPIAVNQRKANGTVVPVGRDTSLDSMSIQGFAADADGDEVRVEVELRPLGVGFSGTATASGSFAPAGTASTAVISGLVDRSYHWHYRLVDSALEGGPWTSFGDNAEEEADFVVPQLGSLSASTCLQASGAGLPILAGPVLMILLSTFRRR